MVTKQPVVIKIVTTAVEMPLARSMIVFNSKEYQSYRNNQTFLLDMIVSATQDTPVTAPFAVQIVTRMEFLTKSCPVTTQLALPIIVQLYQTLARRILIRTEWATGMRSYLPKSQFLIAATMTSTTMEWTILRIIAHGHQTRTRPTVIVMDQAMCAMIVLMFTTHFRNQMILDFPPPVPVV